MQGVLHSAVNRGWICSGGTSNAQMSFQPPKWWERHESNWKETQNACLTAKPWQNPYITRHGLHSVEFKVQLALTAQLHIHGTAVVAGTSCCPELACPCKPNPLWGEGVNGENPFPALQSSEQGCSATSGTVLPTGHRRLTPNYAIASYLNEHHTPPPAWHKHFYIKIGSRCAAGDWLICLRSGWQSWCCTQSCHAHCLLLGKEKQPPAKPSTQRPPCDAGGSTRR